MSTKSRKASAVVVTDPRPAAAYLLGGHSRMLKGWIDGADWPRDYTGPHTSLIINLNVMDSAALDLQDEIEARVYADLRAAIEAVKIFVEDNIWYNQAIQNSAIMCSEANRAFPRSHPLFGWYDFGRVVGSCWQTVSELKEGERLPDFSILQERARELLDTSGKEIPVLHLLVDVKSLLKRKPLKAFWTVLKGARTDNHYTLFGSEKFDISRAGMCLGAVILLAELHNVVHRQLRMLTRPKECPKETPIWDEAMSELLWRGGVIREYKKHPASNQKVILAAFQRADWPPRIDDPFAQMPPLDRPTLTKTIYELNRGLPEGTIRFESDGTGKGIRWRSLN